jgi:hypothetical protein
VSSDLPKEVREALCAAQSALNERARAGIDVHRVPTWVEQIQVLINAVEEHRPLAANGKHGDLHTPTCGCDGHRHTWAILLHPTLDAG